MTPPPTTKKLKVKTQEEINAEQLRLDKCDFILSCLESSRVDSDRCMPGGEATFQLTFDEAEVFRLKAKLFELVKEF